MSKLEYLTAHPPIEGGEHVPDEKKNHRLFLMKIIGVPSCKLLFIFYIMQDDIVHAELHMYPTTILFGGVYVGGGGGRSSGAASIGHGGEGACAPLNI